LDDYLAGIASNPTGAELIKLFFKHAVNSPPKRTELLKQFCAKVWSFLLFSLANSFALKIAVRLSFTLDDIENQIPLKYQRQLLLEMQQYDQSM
jgi:hypothetical protein